MCVLSRELNLRGWRLKNEYIYDKIASGSLARLMVLGLNGNQIGDVGMTELSRAIAIKRKSTGTWRWEGRGICAVGRRRHQGDIDF